MNSVKGGYDEVEFLYSRSSEPFACQFCGTELSRLKEKERQAHYEEHLSDQGSTSGSGRVQDPPSDKNVFWRPSFETLPPDGFTPNLIPILMEALILSHQDGATRKAGLCYNKSVHVGAQWWDRLWGCGYRNFLMACIALMEQNKQPGYAELLNKPIPPGVDNLQRWIEDAWDLGYDVQGAKDFRRRLVGTWKWIGTGELYFAFVSRGVPCQLVDFRSDQKGTAADKVARWIANHFSPSHEGAQTVNDVLNGAVTVTELMPVILQHVGHSRTVVGYEVQKNGECNLLVFDPSRIPRSSLRATALGLQAGVGTSSRVPKDKNHPINDMKARKRKTSPGVIDLTRPSQKRPRSASSSDVIVLGEPTESSEFITVDVESQIGRPPSIELEESESVTKADLMKLMLSWSRLPVKRLRGKDKYQILHFPLTAPLTDAKKAESKVVTSIRF